MNTNPNAIRILCFGDSNTWSRSGKSPDRYPPTIRWTALLQDKLGPGYEVIEEGLRSRTTDLDDDDPQFPHRNGRSYLIPCLESHSPLDTVILWLGTNDLKQKFNREPSDIANAIEQLINDIKSAVENVRIILVSPPLVREEVLKPKTQFMGAGEKSKKLASFYEQLASKYQCTFVDLAAHVSPGIDDGVHLDPEAHSVVADLLYNSVKNTK